MAIRFPLQNYTLWSDTVTATGNGTAVVLPYHDFDSAVLELGVSAASGTTPTLDVYVQTSLDGGTNWLDMVHFTQLTTTTTDSLFAVLSLDSARHVGVVGSKTITAGNMGVPMLAPIMRVAYTVGGTTPSFTASVKLHVNNASPAN